MQGDTTSEIPAPSRWSQRLALGIALGIPTLLFVLLLARGTVFYHRYIQDAFIHLNAVRQMEAGEWPHLGFSTPIGFFYYLLFWLGAQIAPLGAYTAVYANGIAAALAMGLALVTGHRRLPLHWTALLVLFVGVLALAPRHFGAFDITYNAAYNRWSWAFFAILAVATGLPSRGSDRRSVVTDALLAAVLLTLLAYLKMTYAVVGAGLVAVSTVTVQRGRAPWLYGAVAASGAFVLFVAIGGATGLLLPYLSDLIAAGQAQGGGRLTQMLLTAYTLASDFMLVMVIALGMAALVAGRVRVAPLLFVLALLASGLILATQNNFAFEIPLIPVAALVAWQLSVRETDAPGARVRSAATSHRRAASLLTAAVVLLLFARPLVLDLRSLALGIVASDEEGADTLWLRGTILRDLRVQANSNTVFAQDRCRTGNPKINHDNDREYLSILRDGQMLLQRNGAAGQRVFSLIWTDPFPVLNDAPSVRGTLSWWDHGRSFDDTHHPAAGPLLAQAQFVMVPRFEWGWFNRAPEAMLRIYGAQIRRDFTLRGQTACWQLFARRQPSDAYGRSDAAHQAGAVPD